MAIKTINGMFACSQCGTIYTNAIRADACRDNHDMVYIPFTSAELNGLIMFIHLRQEELLSETLIEKLNKFARQSNRTLTNKNDMV